MTIKERLTVQVRVLSEDIRRIKEGASRMGDRTYVAYVDKEGREHKYWAMGRRFKRVTGSVQVSSINPKHPKWEEYLRLKRQVSILLTQKAILKAFGEDKIESITKEDVRNMISAGFLGNHAKRPSRIAYGAARQLRRLARAEIALLPQVVA